MTKQIDQDVLIMKNILSSKFVLEKDEIKKVREYLGFSQAYIANAFGLKNRSSIAHIESGRKSLGVSQNYQLCDMLKNKLRDEGHKDV